MRTWVAGPSLAPVFLHPLNVFYNRAEPETLDVCDKYGRRKTNVHWLCQVVLHTDQGQVTIAHWWGRAFR